MWSVSDFVYDCVEMCRNLSLGMSNLRLKIALVIAAVSPSSAKYCVNKRRHHRPPGLLGGRGDVRRSASVKSTRYRVQSCGVDASFVNWRHGLVFQCCAVKSSFHTLQSCVYLLTYLFADWLRVQVDPSWHDRNRVDSPASLLHLQTVRHADVAAPRRVGVSRTGCRNAPLFRFCRSASTIIYRSPDVTAGQSVESNLRVPSCSEEIGNLDMSEILLGVGEVSGRKSCR